MKRVSLVLSMFVVMLAILVVTASLAFAVPRQVTNPGGQQPNGQQEHPCKENDLRGNFTCEKP